MTGAGDGRIAGEQLPRWLPLPIAVLGIIGSIVTAQIAVGAIDGDPDPDISSPAGPAAVLDDNTASSDATGPEADTTGSAADADASAQDGAESQASAQSAGSAADATSADSGSTGSGSSTDGQSAGGAETADGGSDPAEDCPPLFEVMFPLGRADVPMDMEARAQALASWMAANPEAVLLIDGHADAAGSEQANLELSFRRAEAVATLVIGSGAAADRVTPRGFGEYQPIVGEPLDSERNRRVTMHVPGREDCPSVDAAADPVDDSADDPPDDEEATE